MGEVLRLGNIHFPGKTAGHSPKRSIQKTHERVNERGKEGER
jgi:hypothetical protein